MLRESVKILMCDGNGINSYSGVTLNCADDRIGLDCAVFNVPSNRV